MVSLFVPKCDQYLNDINLAQFATSFAINPSVGIEKASAVGNRQLIEYYIDNKPNYSLIFDLYRGLSIAIKNNHINLVYFFINKIENDGENDWNWPLCTAVECENIYLINLFITKGATDWNGCMCRAAENGNKELVDFFIMKGANDWNEAMYRAARNSHKNLIDFFIEKGATDWHKGILATTNNIGLHDFFEQKIRETNKSFVIRCLTTY